jgi:diguanylate cyclase (GGDEF)-like protein
MSPCGGLIFLTSTSARSRIRPSFRSLAARISFFVFAATLISALAVAWTSAHALRAFLRSKVEQKIPAAVAQLRDRLDIWYAQRVLDVEVFARSAIVVDGVGPLARARGAGRESRGSEEVRKYLAYVLDGFPQYASLFALDGDGRVALAVGREPGLAPDVLADLARVDNTAVSHVLETEAGPVQAISSAVRGPDGSRLLTLHALLPVTALEEQLSAQEIGPSARIFVFDERGALVAASEHGRLRPGEASPQRLAVEPGAVRDYVAGDGLRVVGSAIAFPRVGFTLVAEESYDDAFAPIASILGHTVALNLGIVVVLSGIAFAIVARIVRPIHALSDCAQRLRDGETEVTIPSIASPHEVAILTRSFREMVESLQRANETLEQLAITDGLTKIHNHRFFQDQLTKEIRRHERTGAPLALALVDLDDFKKLNDRHGHAAGDAVLERLAALLVERTRDHDLVARYGGEEFAVLAPETDLPGALALAEQLRLAVCEAPLAVSAEGTEIPCTVSIGVSIYRGDRETFFREADRALYDAKGAGKDCVVAAR